MNMANLHLRIITPKKIVREDDVDLVTAPTIDGEITILPRHMKLFTLLQEGIVLIKKENKEEDLAIGGGYLQTDGKDLNILVSRAYGQNEIDKELIEKAVKEAQNLLKTAKDEKQRHEASALLRRSIVDLKLLRRRRPRTTS